MEILYLTTEKFGTIHIILPVWICVVYAILFVAGIIAGAIKESK